MFFDKVVEITLPIFECADPLVVLEGSYVADVLESEKMLDLLLDYFEDTGKERALLSEEVPKFLLLLACLPVSSQGK